MFLIFHTKQLAAKRDTTCFKIKQKLVASFIYPFTHKYILISLVFDHIT